MIIICRVSWPKVVAVYMLPFLFLFVGYILLSPKSPEEIFTIENLTASTPFRPSPIISIACVIIFVYLLIRFIYNLIKDSGAYIWIEDNYLVWRSKKISRLENIDPQSIYISNRLAGRRLVVFTVDGNEFSISLVIAKKFDNSDLENLKLAVMSRSHHRANR